MRVRRNSDSNAAVPCERDTVPGRAVQALPFRHGRAQPDVIAVIALGGMVGSSTRYAIGLAIPHPPESFPWATFGVNVSGSFVLAFMLVMLLEWFPPTRYLRPFAATGILGAYTTMSTYLVDTAELVRDGHVVTAAAYGLGSILAGLAVAYAGLVTARMVGRLRDRDTQLLEEP